MSDDLKQREEEKRARCWEPRERWRVIQETIRWVDSQQPIPRNSRQACLNKQARLLRTLSTSNGALRSDENVPYPVEPS